MTDEQVVALVDGAKMETLERIEKAETALLKEFRKWAVRIEAGMRVNEASRVGFEARIQMLEERLDGLENPSN